MRVDEIGGCSMPLRHESLVAWQRADDLFINIHRLTVEQFPAMERFALASQLRRAAYSVAANIVEGFARRHRGARLHFLNIAEGSLAEVGYGLHVARRLGYLASTQFDEFQLALNKVGAPLAGLVRSTRAMRDNLGNDLRGSQPSCPSRPSRLPALPAPSRPSCPSSPSRPNSPRPFGV
jgi:four helix bundle protein